MMKLKAGAAYFTASKEVFSLNEVVKFLTENPVQYFATVGLDGKPKVRPFQFMLKKDGKFYFCTGKGKNVYQEMQKNPFVELCASSADSRWIRMSGKAAFSGDRAVKEQIIEGNPLVKSIYKSADNPDFLIFYLEDAKAVISDFSGNPPEEFEL